MKTRILLLVFFFSLVPFTVAAQEAEGGITLRLTRDWGYGGFGGEIQGTFSMRVTGPENLARVEYYMDDQVIAEISQPPFNFQFHTGNFEPGVHTLYAIGYSQDGKAFQSTQFTREFLSAEEAGQATKGIILPVLVVIGVIAILGVLVPVFLGRRGEFKPGVYGVAGGAVCPRCTFPYSRHMLAPNMLLGKLERCPHCGKWAIARAASRSELEAAEARWSAESGGAINTPGETEKFQRMLDESRFED
jgi:hypothetical protein